jgi:hypothetical protein
MLLLSFPTVIAHHIDIYSMLHPPVPTLVNPDGLVLRQADSVTCNREECICPICGESYGTHERLVHHIRFQQMIEIKDKYPVEGTHLSIDETILETSKYPITDMLTLQQHFDSEISEVIAVVEGIDPIMSGTFQALHSYKMEDIVWDAQAEFTPCLDVNPNNGSALAVNLVKFHETQRRNAC